MAGYQSFTVSVPNEFNDYIALELGLFSEAVDLGGEFTQWVTQPGFPDAALSYLEALLGINCL